jgi:hypothetical protein
MMNKVRGKNMRNELDEGNEVKRESSKQCERGTGHNNRKKGKVYEMKSTISVIIQIQDSKRSACESVGR